MSKSTITLRTAALAALLAVAAVSPLTSRADDWMARLSDSLRVADVSIPGTHDAATGDGFLHPYGGDAVRLAATQHCTIAAQWASGIRAFDLRPDVLAADGAQPVLQVYHGLFATTRTLYSVLRQLCDSLDAHPSEFAVVLLRHESHPTRDGSQWPQLMAATLGRVATHMAAFSPSMTVGETRGKILLIARDTYDGPQYGAMASGWGHSDSPVEATLSGPHGTAKLMLQDYYDTSSPDGPVRKGVAIRRLCAAKDGTVRAGVPTWAINHTSGYAQVTTYGSDHDMSTSLGYRLNAHDTNIMLTRLLVRRSRHTGIVMMDFAATDTCLGTDVGGLALTRAVIDTNFRTPRPRR